MVRCIFSMDEITNMEQLECTLSHLEKATEEEEFNLEVCKENRITYYMVDLIKLIAMFCENETEGNNFIERISKIIEKLDNYLID